MRSIAGNFKKFIDLASFAKANSTFYSGLYKDIDQFTLENLSSVPIISKESFYDFSPPGHSDMLTGPLQGGYFTRSGGTSGKEKYAFTTSEEVRIGSELLGTMLSKCGIGKKDTVANLFMPGNMYSAFSSISISLDFTGCVQLPIGANCSSEDIIKYLHAFRPNVILAVPSLLMGLANLVESLDLDIRAEKIGYAGEHLNESSREYLRKVLGAENIFSLGYAAVDTGIIGYQDSTCKGSVHKVPEEHVLVEVVHPETLEHVETGQQGLIIVTNLFRKRLPVIRYDVGDLGILSRDGDAVTLKLLGRAGNNIMICGYEVPLSVFSEILTDFSIESSYQLEIDAIGPKIKITVNYESPDVKKAFSPEFLKERLIDTNPLFARMFEADLLLPLEIHWAMPGALKKNQASGKMIKVIDKRS